MRSRTVSAWSDEQSFRQWKQRNDTQVKHSSIDVAGSNMAHLLRRTTRFVQDNYTFKRAIVNNLPIEQHKDKMTRNFGGEHEVSNRRQGFAYLGAEQIVVRIPQDFSELK